MATILEPRGVEMLVPQTPEHKTKINAESMAQGAQVTAQRVEALTHELDRPIIVSLAAGTGGGKGYFAREHLLPQLSDRELQPFTLESDDFFEGAVEINGETTFDDPSCVNTQELAELLGEIKQGRMVATVAKYNFDTATRELETTYNFRGSDVIIVDGIFALQSEVAKQADLGVFIEADTMQRFLHRFVRDVAERPFIPPRSILPYLLDNHWRHLTWVERSKAAANVVVNGNLEQDQYDALIERALALTDPGTHEPYITTEELENCSKTVRLIEQSYYAGRQSMAA